MADTIKDEVFVEVEFDRYVWWRSVNHLGWQRITEKEGFRN